MTHYPMYNDIVQFPAQFQISHKAVELLDLSSLSTRSITKIYLAGMGGSALPTDVVNDFLFGVPEAPFIEIVRDYRLPARVDAESLVVCSSYSGNTEETLATFAEAQKRGSAVVVMTHGGALWEAGQKAKVPCVRIPACIQPRQASGHFFASLLTLLQRLELVPPVTQHFSGLASYLEKNKKEFEQIGIKIAAFLDKKLPIIYAPVELASLARIFKIKINENAKLPAFYNVFPELNHNEMVGWTRLNCTPALVNFKTAWTHKRNLLRSQVIQKVLNGAGEKIPFFEVELKGESLLQDLFGSLMIADFATYYMAVNAGIDPAPVDMVENFKKLLV